MENFWFTYDTDISDFTKFEGTFEIEKILNENFELSNYTKQVQKIVFVYIALNPDNKYIIKNFIKYRTKAKVYEVGVNLPYQDFLNADKQQAIKLLKDAYIEGFATLVSTKKEFDNKKFLEDLKKLF